MKIFFVEIIILVIDETRQLTIVQYRFPWRWFEPFYQYHLNLQSTLKQTAQTTCLYISIMHKKSSLSKENIRYFGLEVLLNEFDVSLTMNQSMYAVSRIVPDYKSYKYVFFFLKGELEEKIIKLFIYLLIDMIIYLITLIKNWVLNLKKLFFQIIKILSYLNFPMLVILKYH